MFHLIFETFTFIIKKNLSPVILKLHNKDFISKENTESMAADKLMSSVTYSALISQYTFVGIST